MIFDKKMCKVLEKYLWEGMTWRENKIKIFFCQTGYGSGAVTERGCHMVALI